MDWDDPAPQPKKKTGSWKRALDKLFNGRIEKRAVEIKEIIEILEAMPFADSPMDKDYIFYNPEEEISEESCLSPASKQLIKTLKEPLVFKSTDNIRALNGLLLTLAGDFRESVRVGDVDRAYFCLDALRNLICKMRVRIAAIKDADVRNKYIEDVISYGKLAVTTSGFYQQKWDLDDNLERLLNLSEEYTAQRAELENKYASHIYANGGEEFHARILANEKTIAQLLAEGDVVMATVLGISRDYAFMELPMKLATICVSVVQQKNDLVGNTINNSQVILMKFPTLNDEKKYAEFQKDMDNQMEQAVRDIVENNKRVESAIAWSNYADVISDQLVSGEKVLENKGIVALDRTLQEEEEYANVVPLTEEQLTEKKKQRRQEKLAAQQKAVQQAAEVWEEVQQNVQIQDIEQQNVLRVDAD